MSSLFESFTKSLNGAENIVVAFSGGVDSTVLLHLAYEYRKQRANANVKAVHINHQLSPNADTWVVHCEKLCEKLNIPFEVYPVNVEAYLHLGTEGAARKARYEALLSASSDTARILLGQHGDDQAETFLLQVARGAGPKGLSSMGGEYSVEGKVFIRPLLSHSQVDILHYAARHHLQWIEDESNQNTDFDRNYIRNKLMPLIQKRWPSFSRSAAKSAKMCASEMLVLNEYMAVLSKDLLGDSLELLLGPLQTHSTNTQASFIRYWLAMHDVLMPSEKVLEEILHMHSAKQDACPFVSIGKVKVRRYMHALYVDSDDSTSSDGKSTSAKSVVVDASKKHIIITDQNSHNVTTIRVLEKNCLQDSSDDLASSNIFFAAGISSIRVEFGKLSERFKPYANRPAKKLKAWCKEWRIPPWQRQRLALIYVDDFFVGLIDNESCVILSSEKLIDEKKSCFVID